MKNYIYGNWKMNQNLEEVLFFAQNLNIEKISCEMGIAPQAIHIMKLIEKSKNILIGAQNCSFEKKGPYTGELSAKSLKDINTNFVILGHSERRALFGENSKDLKLKLNQALQVDLKVILCIGETLEERESGKAFEVVKTQLEEVLDSNHFSLTDNELLIAYEPVWAIGTGKAATPEMAEEIHAFIRLTLKNLSINLEKIPLLYGGSVKPSNAQELLSMQNINGALIGGASLKADDYQKICQIASKTFL